MLLCSVAIVVAALFGCTHSVTETMEKVSHAQANPQRFAKYKAITGDNENEIVVAGLKKRYLRRDKDGCVDKVEFYNDKAKCAEECLDILNKEPPESTWRPAIETDKTDRQIKIPVIWGEKLVGAGRTKGDSDACVDWRFTVAGSPGWDCDYIGAHDRMVCSCIGFYVGNPDYPQYDPPGYCCDPNGCVPKP